MLLFRWWIEHCYGKAGKVVTAGDEQEVASMFWIQVASPAIHKTYWYRKPRDLIPLTHDVYHDVLVVKRRATKGMRSVFHSEFFFILMSKTRTSMHIMLWAHGQIHEGVDVTILTATQKAWIVEEWSLTQRITSICVRCRYLGKKLDGQRIVQLPPRLTVLPADLEEICC